MSPIQTIVDEIEDRLADATLTLDDIAVLLDETSAMRVALGLSEQRVLAALRRLSLRHLTDGDRLLDVHQAAERLAVSRSWIQHRHDRLPWVVRLDGGAVRYSSRGIEQDLRRRTRRSKQ